MKHIKPFEPLFGEWYVESFIGAGSFGRVYKIYRENFGRRFYSALKFIRVPQETEEITQLRLNGMDRDSIAAYYKATAADISEEIDLMYKLRGNTNVVCFEDSRIVPQEQGVGYDIFIRMELLKSLTRRMLEAPLSPAEVTKLGMDICSALVLCRNFGIIHRDIKPENIFVSETGSYKLGDFGIARKLEKTATFMSRKGTYNYMAPEVYRGEKYGASCDIYSLGLVMYRLLNRGRLPFLPPAPKIITPADNENALIARLSGKKPAPPCDADETLAGIVLKACAFDQKDRYRTADEMLEALTEYVRGESIDPSLGAEPVLPDALTEDEPTESIAAAAVHGFFTQAEAIQQTPAQAAERNAPAEAPQSGNRWSEVYYGNKTVSVSGAPNIPGAGEDAAEEAPYAFEEPMQTYGDSVFEHEFAQVRELPIRFADPKLKTAFRKLYGIEHSITTDELRETRVLQLNSCGIRELDGLEIFRNLRELNADGNRINGFYALAGLHGLERLSLKQNGLTRIDGITLLSGLKKLNLEENRINNLMPLSGLANLTYLYLNDNEIANVIPLSGLKTLRELDLHNNTIENIAPLAGLTGLENLWLDQNELCDISAIAGMANLITLWLGDNQIYDLRPLSNLKNLTAIGLENNRISDISPLAGLKRLSNLSLEKNQISDICDLSQLKELEWLYLSKNSISELYPLYELGKLREVYLYDNPITKREIKELKAALPNCTVHF